VTAIQEPEEENRKDWLTQLQNRSGLRALAETIDASPDRAYGLLVIDLDRLKTFNTEYGHRVGDAALVHFASRLTEALGDSDLFRTGGDEFLAVLANASPDTACACAERVCERVRDRPFLPTGGASMLTTSIGVACAPWHGATMEAVRCVADRALYDSKKNGRDRWTLASY
jgi:diguanylate cyclase (GGDEF)-like protein